jgi:hypothetical protein
MANSHTTKRKKLTGYNTGHKNTFVFDSPNISLRVIIIGPKNEPVINAPYKLIVGHNSYEGVTGSEAQIEEEIPAFADRAELIITEFDGAQTTIWHWFLGIGGLASVSRFPDAHLGFLADPAGGGLGPLTTAAIVAYQNHFHLPATGITDLPTRLKLLEQDGSVYTLGNPGEIVLESYVLRSSEQGNYYNILVCHPPDDPSSGPPVPPAVAPVPDGGTSPPENGENGDLVLRLDKA